jgi:pyruvate-formate lyase-activating enzyme
MKKKVYKQVLKNYMFKREHEEGIIEMHYEHSIVSMMGKMLIGVVLKSLRCIFCHNPLILEFNSSTKESISLITYYKTY